MIDEKGGEGGGGGGGEKVTEFKITTKKCSPFQLNPELKLYKLGAARHYSTVLMSGVFWWLFSLCAFSSSLLSPSLMVGKVSTWKINLTSSGGGGGSLLGESVVINHQLLLLQSTQSSTQSLILNRNQQANPVCLCVSWHTCTLNCKPKKN